MNRSLSVASALRVFLACLVGLCVVAVLAAHLWGIRLYRITSGSMEPGIPTGSLILTRSVPASGLEIGDIVTTSRSAESRNVTHRIVQISSEGEGYALTLKGDANPYPDSMTYAVETAQRYLLTVN